MAQEPKQISTRTSKVRPTRISFKRGNKFRVIENGCEIFADIEDDTFMDQVMNGEVAFSALTVLEVSMRQDIYHGEKVDEFRHSIEKVISMYERPVGETETIE